MSIYYVDFKIYYLGGCPVLDDNFWYIVELLFFYLPELLNLCEKIWRELLQISLFQVRFLPRV